MKELLFMLLLFAALPLLSQGTQDDTVWTHSFEGGPTVQCVKFSPDGRLIAAACNYSPVDTSKLSLLDVETGKVIREFIGHKKPIYSIAFSSTGDTLFSCGEDNYIILWDVKTGDSLSMITQNLQIHQLALSPNSKYLVFSSINNNGYENPNYLNLWNIEEKQIIKSVDIQGQVEKISYDPSGKYLGIPTDHRYGFSKPPYNAVRLYDADNLSEISLFGWHDYEIYDLAFSPDGTMIATASMDHTCKIWSIEKSKLLKEYNSKNEGQMLCCVFSNSSKYLVFSSSIWDNWTTKIWNLETDLINYIYPYFSQSADVVENDEFIVIGGIGNVTLLNARWNGTNIKEEEMKIEEIIYPNPSDNFFYIKFNLLKSGIATVDIYNEQGILIENILDEYLDAGFHSIIWNSNLVSSGIFFCNIQSGSYSKTFKLILSK